MQRFDNQDDMPGALKSASGHDAAIIRDGDMSSFMVDVIEKSAAVPVLVSFYSSWSESCKQLAPLLEKIVTLAEGAIHMVRVDFDKNKPLAAQMKIQSVPTVVVFVDQRPVDAFAGLKSSAEIREFIARFAPGMQPSATEQIMEQAVSLFDGGDYHDAHKLYSHILQGEAENADAIAGLVQCLIRLDDLEQAGAVLATVPKQHQSHPPIEAARAALDLAQQFSGLGAANDTGALEQALKKDENNHQTRFDLALILWSGDERQAAADHLLTIVAQDRGWNDDQARKQLIKFFEIAGPQDPFTIQTRKKLSSILFS